MMPVMNIDFEKNELRRGLRFISNGFIELL